MNLNIKKIALIMAAGIFALSTAFGAENSLEIKKIKLTSDAPNYKIKLKIQTGDSEEEVTPGKEITINKPITKIKLKVEKKGSAKDSGANTVRVTADEKSADIMVKERNLTTAQALEAAFEEIQLPVKVKAKINGKTLTITIKEKKEKEPKINIFLQ